MRKAAPKVQPIKEEGKACVRQLTVYEPQQPRESGVDQNAESLVTIVGDSGSWTAEGCDLSVMFHPTLEVEFFIEEKRNRGKKSRKEQPEEYSDSIQQSPAALQHMRPVELGAVPPLIAFNAKYALVLNAAWLEEGTKIDFRMIDVNAESEVDPDVADLVQRGFVTVTHERQEEKRISLSGPLKQPVHIITFEVSSDAIAPSEGTERRGRRRRVSAPDPTEVVLELSVVNDRVTTNRRLLATASGVTQVSNIGASALVFSRPVILRSAVPLRKAATLLRDLPMTHNGAVIESKLSPASKKFWLTDVLGPSDTIAGGFVDPGRSNTLCDNTIDYQKMRELDREVLYVDEENPSLITIVDRALQTLTHIQDSVARAQSLFWYVAAALGGMQLDERVVEEKLMHLRRSNDSKKLHIDAQRDLASIDADHIIDHKVSLTPQKSTVGRCRRYRPSDLGPNVVSLGDVSLGLCRHRALLFKLLCDKCHVPCWLVRGTHGTNDDTDAVERHTWNLVYVRDRVQLADTMLQTELMHWPHPSYHTVASNGIDEEISSLHRLQFRSMEIEGYKIVQHEAVGKGVSAVVRRATMGPMTFAIKTPRNSTTDRADLEHEYHMLCKFKSNPAIVTVFGWREGLLMEYVPYSLLSVINTLVIRKMVLSPKQQLKVLTAIASAMCDLHQKKVVHRDIKSENILVAVRRCSECIQYGVMCPRCDLVAQLADFVDAVDLAEAAEDRSDDSVLVKKLAAPAGTAPYAAPEVEAGDFCALASDVWSFGVLAWELSTMQLPSASTHNGRLVKNPYYRADGNNAGSCSNGQVLVPVANGGQRLEPWCQKLLQGCLQVAWTKRISATEVSNILQRAASVSKGPKGPSDVQSNI